MTGRVAVWLFGLASAVLIATRASAQYDDPCEEPEEVDFPVLNIPFNKACSSPADCGPGEGCETIREFGEISGPFCSDFTADFLDDCDNPQGPRMASPGCKQNVGLQCDIEYNGQEGFLISAVCRKDPGGSCTQDSDCRGGWFESPDIVCVDGTCQQFGFAENCSGDGERCSGGQVCTTADNSLWIDGSTPTYACFNRGNRGDACKAGFPNNGYTCKDENEVDYKLLCEGSVETATNQITPGVCKSYTYEIGAECNENILCGQSECIDGKCTKVDEPAGTECSATTDCDANEAPDSECLNGRCVPFGYVGECFSDGDTCPGGQTCFGINFNGRPACINRAGKGEPCKSPRQGPFNGYACKPSSETGFDMSCVFGEDAVGLPGPGPGGAGGGVAGTGLCMERAADGATCGDDIFVTCDFFSECVDGTCTNTNTR